MTKYEAELKSKACFNWLKKRTLCSFQFATHVYSVAKNKEYESLGYHSALAWFLDKCSLGRMNFFYYKKLGRLAPKILEWLPAVLLEGLDISKILNALPQIDKARTQQQLIEIFEAIRTHEAREISKKLDPTPEITFETVICKMRGGKVEMDFSRYPGWAGKCSIQNLFKEFGNQKLECTLKLKRKK